MPRTLSPLGSIQHGLPGLPAWKKKPALTAGRSNDAMKQTLYSENLFVRTIGKSEILSATAPEVRATFRAPVCLLSEKDQPVAALAD